MTIQQRAAAFAAAFPEWPASHLRIVQEHRRDVLYGIWVIGNDYRGSGYYGSYPPGFVRRVRALFPDVEDCALLHAFSGAMLEGEYYRLDSNEDNGAELTGSVYDVRTLVDGVIADDCFFHLIMAAADAEQYDTPMISRRKALAALATVTAPSRHLAWLDTCWPMHSKRDWLTVGRILVQRSTNHRARVLSIFERTAS